MKQNIKYLEFQTADKDIYIPSEKEIKENEKKEKKKKEKKKRERYSCKVCTIQ